MSSCRAYKLKTAIRALTILLIVGAALLFLLMAYRSSLSDLPATAVSPDNIIGFMEDLKQGGAAQ